MRPTIGRSSFYQCFPASATSTSEARPGSSIHLLININVRIYGIDHFLKFTCKWMMKCIPGIYRSILHVRAIRISSGKWYDSMGGEGSADWIEFANS